jgi:aryl-alcohol dehydrogenase-like predicted oxidoreductase
MNLVNYNSLFTSNIGFGCSSLTRNNTPSSALSNLEVAFDNGIRHFDCAKLYGYGNAESILAAFAKGKRHAITIATKSGLDPIKVPLFCLPLINKLKGPINFFKSSISIKSDNITNTAKGHFTPLKLEKDINSSLVKLKTNYIDFYLLHEASVVDANRDDIINVMNKAKMSGKIRHYGVASNYYNLVNDFSILDESYEVVQHNASLTNIEVDTLSINDNKRLRILYNIFSNIKKVSSELKYIELGFNSPVEYILSHYKKINSNGITLFTSTNNKNIKDTVKIWESLH